MLSVLLILPDFLIILLGYLLKQGKLGQHFNEGFWKGAENIVFYVLFPPLLFTSVANSKLSLADAGYFLAVAVGTMFLAVLLSWLVRKIVPADDVTHASVFHCGFRFNSYVGFAIIMRLAGEEGFAFFAFLMAFWVPISSSIAVSALAGAVARAENVQKKGGLWKKTVKTIFTNPLIIATVSGLLVNVFAVRIPEVLMHFLKSLGNASLAMGLLCIGAGLKIENLRAHFPLIAASTVERLVAVPLVALGTAWFFQLEPLGAAALLVFAALPTAQSCYVMTASMRGNAPIVAEVTTAHTLAAMVTLPVWVAVIQNVFLAG